MSRRSRAFRAATAVATVLSAIPLGVAAQAVAFDWDMPRSWLPDLMVGLVLVSAGSVAWARGTVADPVAGLVVVAGVVWWSGNFAEAEAGWVAWVAAQLTFGHRALLVHGAMEGSGAVRRWDGRVVLLGAYVGASPLLATSPAVSAVLALALVAVVLRRTGHAETLAGSTGHISLATFVVAATLGLTVLQDLVGGSGGLWLLLYQVGLTASALALTLPWRRTFPTVVTDLVVRLGDEAGGVPAVLADVLGDPGIRIVEASADGHDVTGLGDSYVATPVWTHGQRATFLVHRRTLQDDPELTASLVRAVGLLLENERLQLDLRTRVTEVESSRARLVRVADEEGAQLRGRIQRGAGARLDAVVAELRRAADSSKGERYDRSAGNDGAETTVTALVVTAAERAVRVRQDLADVEHALVPDLNRHPLVEALEELAGASHLPVGVSAEGPLDVSRDVAAVAWFVCAEGLTNVARHAGASGAVISVSQREGRLRVTVEDDGRGVQGAASGAGLRNLRDRVEAIGGELHIGPGVRAGTTLAAEMPLGGQGR